MTSRIFIGGFIEQEILGNKYAELREDFDLVAGGKWVAPSNLHFTLKFLGDVDTAKIPQIGDVLRNYLCVHFDNILIRGVGFFPNQFAPKILYAKVHSPSGFLKQLHSEIEARLEPLGFPKEERPFVPHITLKRIKDVQIYRVSEFLQKYGEMNFGIKSVFTLSLIESALTRDGSIYKTIHLPDSDFV